MKILEKLEQTGVNYFTKNELELIIDEFSEKSFKIRQLLFNLYNSKNNKIVDLYFLKSKIDHDFFIKIISIDLELIDSKEYSKFHAILKNEVICKIC